MKNIFFLLFLIVLGFIFIGCENKKNNIDSEMACGVDTTMPSKEVLSGEVLYNKYCIACHQANGMGIPNAFPPIANSDFLVNREQTIAQIINGKTGEIVVNGVKYNSVMPPQPLNNAEIATVLTYVYTNFGNKGGVVTKEEVKAVRGRL